MRFWATLLSAAFLAGIFSISPSLSPVGAETIPGPALLLAQAAPGPIPAGDLHLPRRLSGKPEGLTEEIRTFLNELVRTYQRAHSYRDQGRVKLAQVAGRVKTTTETPMEISFQRPNLLRVEAGHYTATSDGTTLSFLVPSLSQYTASKAPETLERKHLEASSILGGTEEGHPELIDFLILPRAYEKLVSQIAKIGWQSDAVVNGTKCRVLTYETQQGTKVMSYIDSKRMVLLKVEAEISAEAAAAGPPGSTAPPSQSLTTLLYELFPVEINVTFVPTHFALNVPTGCRRVRQFSAAGDPFQADGPHPLDADAAAGSHLLGKAAPAIDGRDVAGDVLRPTDLQGRAVLLFFWALSGGEYSLRSISTVQQVAEHFRNRSEVLVLGVNGDADQAEAVVQFLQRKKVNFRNILDEGLRLQTRFELGGVPTFVLVGADGIVKWAKLGAPPSLKEDLIREIEKLLPNPPK